MEEQTSEDVKPKKSMGKIWTGLLIVLLVFGSFRFGYTQGKQGATFDFKNFKVINQANSTGTVDYNLLWQAIATLQSKYIDKPVDQQKILYGAVKGAVEASGDPYTQFFTPEELQSFKTQLKGSFDGIGAEIGKRNGNVVIIAPLKGSPAEKAGLRSKDVILKVNAEAVSDWSVEQAVTKIRGQKGTTVTLSIFRDGFSEAKDFTITRDTIEVKSVKWEEKEVKAANGSMKKIAVITVSQFGDDTQDLFASTVREVVAKHVDGIVLDLRNNPGGYLDAAVNLASYWLPKGQLVVTEAHSTGQNIPFNSAGLSGFAGVKTVTLINGGSASAAEILSGALHDHKVTTLIGEKSFGKGSVQEIDDLQGGSAIKVTIAKWITPNGKNLNKDGLDPDVQVKMSDDDINNGKDPQMDKALEEVVK